VPYPTTRIPRKTPAALGGGGAAKWRRIKKLRY